MSCIKDYLSKLFNCNSSPSKSTDKGYINKNKQKNLGISQLDGNHYNQKFYHMQCTLCKTEYYANGSDIWLKKCPHCQKGANSTTIASELVEEFKNTPIGTELSRDEIITRVHLHFGRNESSIIPSDYCYNRYNNGINYEKHLHLFEYLGNGKYKYLGIEYPYTGKIYHKQKSGLEICVGELFEGNVITRGRSDVPVDVISDKQTDSILNEPVHKTKRDAGVSLRYKVLKRDNFKCQMCGDSPAKDPSTELHIDHIIPWSRGGETTIDNLQTLCSKCNLGKSNHI